jgi:hypothetical protein
MATKSATYPYTVRTDAGVLVKGHDNETNANADADRRNAASKQLGIRTGFVSTDIPCKKGKDTA